MKKYLLLLSVVIMGLSACKKGDLTAEQAAVDDAKIQAYIAANLSAQSNSIIKDPSGIYYMIIKQGTGSYPTTTSTVQIAYNGKLLNGSTFDSSPNYTNALSGFVPGFQTGMLKIKSGTLGVANTAGRILIIIPSTLAYGATATAKVPANSVIIFTVDLIGVSN